MKPDNVRTPKPVPVPVLIYSRFAAPSEKARRKALKSLISLAFNGGVADRATARQYLATHERIRVIDSASAQIIRFERRL